jgi:predicted DNA binding CopG/RHH family protein
MYNVLVKEFDVLKKRRRVNMAVSEHDLIAANESEQPAMQRFVSFVQQELKGEDTYSFISFE